MYSLESYLIRPIQRILKYPLLLAQIKTICLKDSQPYYKINEALRAIENGGAKFPIDFHYLLIIFPVFFYQLPSTLTKCNVSMKNMEQSLKIYLPTRRIIRKKLPVHMI